MGELSAVASKQKPMSLVLSMKLQFSNLAFDAYAMMPYDMPCSTEFLIVGALFTPPLA